MVGSPLVLCNRSHDGIGFQPVHRPYGTYKGQIKTIRMDLQYDFSSDAANPAQRRIEQLERLLGCFQKALGHELPNQLVALQGLARLIEMEQADRLDEEGRATCCAWPTLPGGWTVW